MIPGPQTEGSPVPSIDSVEWELHPAFDGNLIRLGPIPSGLRLSKDKWERYGGQRVVVGQGTRSATPLATRPAQLREPRRSVNGHARLVAAQIVVQPVRFSVAYQWPEMACAGKNRQANWMWNKACLGILCVLDTYVPSLCHILFSY